MGEVFQGGRLVAQALKAEGVDCVFTLSGGHVMPIYEGCRLEGIRVLDVRHEQAAAHAAEAWGRVRRACGVAVVTAGPGVTGTVTAVANCFAAQTPLVVIGGARPLAQAEQGALQEFDQLSLFKPITKWAAVCSSTARIPEYVAIGFRQALAPPRGPVYLELPMDVLFEEAAADREPAPSRSVRSRLRRPARGDEGRRSAERRRAPRRDRRHRHLVGRRLEAASPPSPRTAACRSSSTAPAAARCRPSTSSSSSTRGAPRSRPPMSSA